ncbi:hypothetical protein E2562_037491 [Oryza meyeriana var. granulata]|uniref:Uncharacterized protein n=1 Tax=Oryza meyeriana var. granulata TaxID=110450 RepID=A0A6G1CXL5_9ORYZ|nr:hypothetical protein E2562_037491 [Oryza meyeriana var. granulata]
MLPSPRGLAAAALLTSPDKGRAKSGWGWMQMSPLPAYPSSPRPGPSPPLLKIPSHSMDRAGFGGGGPPLREGNRPLLCRRLSVRLLCPQVTGAVP